MLAQQKNEIKKILTHRNAGTGANKVRNCWDRSGERTQLRFLQGTM